MKTSQVNAVFQAVCGVLGTEGPFTEKVSLSKDEKDQVIDLVTEDIISGIVEFSEAARAKHDTPEKVRAYTRGMVDNHLRKDKRLNGGVPYVTKNPGSRSNSKDETLKNLNLLLKITPESEKHLIEQEIKNYKAQLAAEAAKSKVASINWDLPALARLKDKLAS